ncbi:hypothetical protein G8A07_05870 [Roseateles sp. DAIF2]|uniref:hypothetical protein n=1 Tax=Roseateles sp. DAIF2 TaxID=2714952 RepID=UPI0018A2B962|nr:hypothetical protein [Roseateles sp. DAIF2]QPF72507.1 hypothetical protein G8A07_05870 [Roseateles sp. DAIF2]
MRETLNRPLNGSEKRRLGADLAHWERRLSPRAKVREAVQAFGAALLVGLGFGLFGSHGFYYSMLGALWVAGLLLLILWVPKERQGRGRLWALRRALAQNRAEVLRVEAEAYVEFEELGDSGAFYLFQTGPRELLLLRGQDYYATGGFPCLSFELVTVPGVLFHIRPLSPAAEPLRRFAPQAMLEFADLEDGRVLPGRLEDAQAALRAALGRPAQTE